MDRASFVAARHVWHPVIGDPDMISWIIVAGYALAAFFCFRAALHARAAPSIAPRFIWSSFALLLLALAINKQLDLQTLVTDIGRRMARDGGWYAERRHYQREFIVALGIGVIVAMAVALWLCRRLGGWLLLALVGVLLLASFVLIRAASFHHIDVALRWTWGRLRLMHGLELSGITIVMLAAIGASANRQRTP